MDESLDGMTKFADFLDPLNGLEAVDWNKLTHAYGSASDVPELIRARASQDPHAVKDADHEFFGNIWHQGTVYAATPFAARFLTRLLLADATLERPALALLLGTLARGNQRDSEPRLWRDQVVHEISAHHDAIWCLLERGTDFQRTIPYLLSALPEAHAKIREEFAHLIDTCSGDETRVGFLMTLVEATRGTDSGVATFSRLLEHHSLSIRFVAALGLSLSVGRKVASQIAPILLEQLASPPVFEATSEFWAWNPSEQLVDDVFRVPDPEFVRSLAAEILPALPTLDNYNAASLAHMCLPSFFDKDSLDGLPSLNREQFALLQQLTRQTNIVYVDDLVSAICKQMNARDMKELHDRLGSPGLTHN